MCVTFFLKWQGDFSYPLEGEQAKIDEISLHCGKKEHGWIFEVQNLSEDKKLELRSCVFKTEVASIVKFRAIILQPSGKTKKIDIAVASLPVFRPAQAYDITISNEIKEGCQNHTISLIFKDVTSNYREDLAKGDVKLDEEAYFYAHLFSKVKNFHKQANPLCKVALLSATLRKNDNDSIHKVFINRYLKINRQAQKNHRKKHAHPNSQPSPKIRASSSLKKGSIT